MNKPVYLANVFAPSFRPGEMAEILEVVIFTPPDLPPRPCYHVRYNSDGREDFVAIHDERTGFHNYFLYSEEAIKEKLLPLIEQYKKAKGFRDGGYAANAAYDEIKKIATTQQLIAILENAW